MELRIPTLEELRTVYERQLKITFSATELKPLAVMENLWQASCSCSTSSTKSCYTYLAEWSIMKSTKNYRLLR